jgi:hypothetical protein
VDKVLSTLRTFGILVAIWVILAIVALATGVLPGMARDGDDPAPVANEDAGVDREEDEPDAGRRVAAARDAGPRAPLDAGIAQPSEPAEPSAPQEGAPRYTVCEGSAQPSLVRAQVFGDDRPELIVGCAAGWEVISIAASGPVRVALFAAPAAPADQRRVAGPAAIGDIDGDGHDDLVLPLSFESAQGASRGGGLYWIPRDAMGGVREPALLAPIAAVDVATGPMDAQSGADIAAMNRTNALAQLPSEAWVIGGGASPSRLATLAVGLSGSAVRVGDLDRDANTDVVALASGRVTIHFGDGQGAFARSHSFELTNAREIAVGDLDGDAGADLAVLGEGLLWIEGGPLTAMEPHPVAGVPPALRGLVMADLNADRRLDLIGWDHPRLFVMHQGENAAFTAIPDTMALADGGTFGPRRHALADLDADGAADDLALLGTSAENGPLELVIVIDALRRVDITPDAAITIPDAPLVLRAALPTPG